MLLQDGSIKVADFGIARFLQSETQTMTDKAIGSVHYIAPEQASGDYITDKADIYSVGVMLYEMLTGKLPFVADNAVSVALMQLQAKPDVYKRQVLKSRESLHGRELDVVVDRQTGVNYVTYLASSSAPLSPLLDKDGKPLTDTLPIDTL